MTATSTLASTPYDHAPELLRPVASAVGLSAVRGLTDGSMRQYSAVEFDRGWNGVEHFVRTLSKLGFVKPPSTDTSYAVLDVLDANGDIVQDYNVPSAEAFRYIKRKLRLTVVDPHEAEAVTR